MGRIVYKENINKNFNENEIISLDESSSEIMKAIRIYHEKLYEESGDSYIYHPEMRRLK